MTQRTATDPPLLAPGDRVGDFRILALLGQEGVMGHAVQHYAVQTVSAGQGSRAEGAGGAEELLLRRILPPPPAARTEAEWLAAVRQGLGSERGPESSAFTQAVAAWSDAQASYLVRRSRPGQSLQDYLAAHPPLSPQDGEVLARGLLGAAQALHSAGLSLPGLTPAQVWLGRGGEVGLRELWAALPPDAPAQPQGPLSSKETGADLQRIGRLLRHAVQPPAPGTPLGRLLEGLDDSQGAGLPLLPLPHSATAALALLDGAAFGDTALRTATGHPATGHPAAMPSDTPPRTAPVTAVTPAAATSGGAAPAASAQPGGWEEQAPQASLTPTARPSRPLWPWLLPVALILGAAAYLTWPSLSRGLRGAEVPVAEASRASTAEGASGPAAREVESSAQVMTLPASLNLRPGADTGGAPLAAIPARQLLTVLSERSGWYKVRYGDLTGWVSSEYVLPVFGAAEVQALTKAATRGGVVTLQRGVYPLDATIQLEWDTELVGQGRDQTYLVGSGGESVLASRDVSLSLRNLSVAWTGENPGQAVRVERGRLTAEGVRLTGGVPDDAQRARGSGLWLRSGAQAQITDSLFTRNGIGISVDSSALTMTGSRVISNRYAGLLFTGRASGQVQDSAIEDHAEDGVVIGGNAAPALSANRIRGNGQRGVDIAGSAAPTLENNQIEGGLYSISVGEQAQPQLRGNTLSGATEDGLLYRAQAGGAAQGNLISGPQTGIRVSESAAPELRGNRITGPRGEGLVYSSAAGGQASGNTIEEAGAASISLSGQAAPTLEGNRLGGGRGSGIVVQGQSKAQLRRNTAENHAEHGIVIKGEAAPTLEQNALLGNGGYGLLYTEAGGGSAERDLCQNNRAGPAAFQLKAGAPGPTVGRDGCLDSVALPIPVPASPASSDPATEPGADTGAASVAPSESVPAEAAPPASTAPAPAGTTPAQPPASDPAPTDAAASPERWFPEIGAEV